MIVVTERSASVMVQSHRPRMVWWADKSRAVAGGLAADHAPVAADVAIQEGFLGLAAFLDRFQGGGGGDDSPKGEFRLYELIHLISGV